MQELVSAAATATPGLPAGILVNSSVFILGIQILLKGAFSSACLQYFDMMSMQCLSLRSGYVAFLSISMLLPHSFQM